LRVISFASPRARRLAPAWATLSIVTALIAAGCGGASDRSVSPASSIAVSERDFAIVAPKSLPAGEVVLRVQNRGPDAHELLIVRAGSGELPMRSDGLTVAEESLAHREIGVLEAAEANAVRDLRVRLTPGRYVLFCNMSGHFIGGMHRVLVVRWP
jgi:uncharacterized cupredoxin-like copper-binding protein